MKREALSSPKLMSLSGHLGISKAQAIGHLTLLWDFTAEHAVGGDVGKWDDEAIARACDWTGDAATFITALVDSRWVDTCVCSRLVVHDWAEHCENWVRAKAARSKVPLLRRGLKSGDFGVESESSCARQNQSNPIQSNPTPRVKTAIEMDAYDRTFEEDGARLAARQAGFEDEEIEDALNDIRSKGTAVAKLKPYLLKVLTSNRQSVAINRAPPRDEFKPKRIPD